MAVEPAVAMEQATVMPNRPSSLTASDYGLYALVVLAWSTSWIAMHYQVGPVAPEVSVFWRFIVASLAIFALAKIRGERLSYGMVDHACFAAMGIFMFSSNFVLFYHASHFLTSGLLSVVFSLTAIINLLLSAILFGQKVAGRVVLGALIGVAGIALLFAPQFASVERNGFTGWGFFLSVCATICFCTGNLFSGISQRRGVSVIAASAWGMAYGAVWAGIIALFLGRAFTLEWTFSYIFALIYLALVASVVAFYSYLTLLGRIGAGRVGYATVMFPVFALLISTVAENYQWTLPAIIGATLALGGNLLVMRK